MSRNRSRMRKGARKDRAKKARRPTSKRDRRQRIAVLLSLDKLSKQLQSDVLSDNAIAREFGLDITNTVDLGPGLSTSRDKLFAAFRQAGQRGTPVTLKLNDATSEAEVALSEKGTGSVTIETTRFLFANAALLLAAPDERLQFANHALARHTLHNASAAELVRLAGGKDASSHEDAFAAMRLLSSTPEAFYAQFKEKLAKAAPEEGLGRDDLLPDDALY